MTEDKELEERIITLETRTAFQERMIDELNSVLTDQQGSITVLAEQVALLMQQVGAGIADKGGDTKPPHY
jgi:SlyX protein